LLRSQQLEESLVSAGQHKDVFLWEQIRLLFFDVVLQQGKGKSSSGTPETKGWSVFPLEVNFIPTSFLHACIFPRVLISGLVIL